MAGYRCAVWYVDEYRGMEDTFSGNKSDDVHEHVERVLDIVSLFNIPGVSHDAVMLRIFPITLTGATKRWVDRLSPGTVNSWDLLKKAFIQRYCPPSKTAKQLKEIRSFKQEGDETLYQAWERFSDNERQETDNAGMAKALAALEATHKIKKVPQEENQSLNYYDDPYPLSLSFDSVFDSEISKSFSLNSY
nr:hypothetical protein [Tanacetum cinerariifolium]